MMHNILHPKNAHIPGLKELWAEAFGDPPTQIDSFFDTAFSPERYMCIIENGKIIAAAYWFDCSYAGGKLAYLYAVATAKSHRGQGCCHRLLSRLHALLAQQNYAGSILVPDEGLGSLYHSMGYDFFSGMDTLSCQAGVGVHLRQIDLIEYAALRRQYLPRDGVIQENENLQYLTTFSKFYTGDGFLLTAAIENGTLLCGELLGDHSQCPGIVAVLHCTHGHFRCPGKADFAMFRPLKNTPIPSYFGLAFD